MTRLSPARLEELYRGTLGLVAEQGFEKITMDQIAEATRSSKATLYRQWGSKTALVVAALQSVTVAPDAPVDTGSLRGDLRAMVAGRSRVIEAEADLVGAILHSMKSDTELRRAVRDQIVAQARTRLRTLLVRAVARGEVDPTNPALRHADLVLMAPFILRLVIDDEPVDDAFLTDYFESVLLPALGVTR